MAFGRFERSRSPAPMSDINITPLVDVMLVLVVLFILAAPLMATSIRLELPRAQAGQGGGAGAAFLLVLDAKGQAYLDDKPVSLQVLELRLREISARAPDTEIQLRADAAVAYGRVVEIMDAAHGAGLRRIGFVAQASALPPSLPPSSPP